MKCFWGKLETPSPQAGERAFHPLIDHCADVAATTFCLLNTAIYQQVLCSLAGVSELPTHWTARLSVLAAMHDFGKANWGFQNKQFPNPPFHAGHVDEAVLLLNDCQRYPRFLDVLMSFRSWFCDDQALVEFFLASICHHGRPVRPHGPARAMLWEARGEMDPLAEIETLVSKARHWFPSAFRVEDADGELPVNARFIHHFCGIVTLADWIASSVIFFPFTTPEQRLNSKFDRFSFARQRAEYALTVIGLNTTPVLQSCVGLPSFEKMTGKKFPMRWAQETLSGLDIPIGPSIEILEASTGDGKTEAALLRFLALFSRGEVGGLYFALPTRTSAIQIYSRICEIVKRVFESEEFRPQVVLAVPGYVSFEGIEARILPGHEVRWSDDQNNESLRERGWAAEGPKRFLAAPIAVGTIDQVLMSGILVPHAHMRSAALRRHFLVVDEVHASDYFMTSLLVKVLEDHVAAGGRALLMSATLGATMANRFLGVVRQLQQEKLNLEEACKVPFPLVRQVSREMDLTFSRSVAVQDLRSRNVQVIIRPIAGKLRELVAIAFAAATEGASVLIIRNKVDDCQDVQRELERVAEQTNSSELLFQCSGLPAPHHARFADADRRLLDLEVERQFGEKRSAAGRILVATQTVQQSLDIDADFLITDLCPMDVLLQRVGRLHRHSRVDRPNRFAEPQVVVCTPEVCTLAEYVLKKDGRGRGPHGLGTVYPDLCILENTWKTLLVFGRLELPKNARSLVEKSLHPQAVDVLVSALPEVWKRHREWNLGSLLGEGRAAADFVLPTRKPFSDLPLFENLGRVATRLGVERRFVEFSPSRSPFGKIIDRVTLPSGWARLFSQEELRAEATSTESGDLKIEVEGVVFHYGRYGLSRENRELQGEETDE